MKSTFPQAACPRVRGLFPLLLAAALAASCSSSSGVAASPRAAYPALADGAPSIEALVDRFVRAVDNADEEGLRRLRVTREEYLNIIVPGSVAIGQPPREIPEESAELHWKMLDAKSRDAARATLQEVGGRKLTREKLWFTRGVTNYDAYSAYGQVRVSVVGEGGREMLLRAGTIAEVGGSFKFVGLNWNE